MTRSYSYNCNGAWFIGAIILGFFISPWFIFGLIPLPEHWSKWLPCTFRRKVDE